MVSFTKISRLICPVARSTSPGVYPCVPAFAMTPSPLEEKRQVLNQQDVLVQDDLALADFPLPIDPAQDVLPFAHQEVSLRFHPVAVNQEAAFDRHLCRLRHGGPHVQELHVGDHMAEA